MRSEKSLKFIGMGVGAGLFFAALCTAASVVTIQGIDGVLGLDGSLGFGTANASDAESLLGLGILGVLVTGYMGSVFTSIATYESGLSNKMPA